MKFETENDIVTSKIMAKECGIIGNKVNLIDLNPDKIKQFP